MTFSLIFSYALIVFGICFGILAGYTFLHMTQQNISRNEKIPRNFIFGAVFAIIDVAWCTPQALLIFSPGSSAWIFPVAIICLVVGCCFLDYLFARALAGFLILLSHYFLLESFAADISCIWLFSIACYVMGTFAIVIGGIPHLLRDLIRKISLNKSWRISFTIIFAFYFLLGVIAGISIIIS
jgi:hypothetical protein